MGKYSAYEWRGINKWGRKAKGYIVAEDDFDAENQSKLLGVTITFLKQRAYLMLPGKITRNIKVLDIVFMMRQLSTLITAGVPLVQAIEIMAMGAEKVKLRALLFTVKDNISAGKSFAESIKQYPEYFNSLISSLIAAGEESGTLDQMVNQVAEYMEHQEYLKNRIKKAMYYPITVMSFAVLIVIGILIFLIPRFEKIYASFNAQLPAFTQMIIDFSHSVQNQWWIYVNSIMFCVILIRIISARYPAFRRIISTIALKIPLFGKLLREAILARVCLTLSITLSAGISLVDALKLIEDVANNILYGDALKQIREEITQGESIANAAKATQLFPPMVVQMIDIGEKSGALDQMLYKAGDYYREQLNSSVEALTTLIEPILIVVIGVIVGIFIVALYLPIFKLGQVI